MTTLLPSLSRTSPLARSLALVSLAAGAWALTAGMSQAHARDVFWSVGVNGPGVTIGASNAPVVVHQPPSYSVAEVETELRTAPARLSKRGRSHPTADRPARRQATSNSS